MEPLQLEAAQIEAACYVQESMKVGLFVSPASPPSAVSFNLSEIKLIGGCWIQGAFLCVSCPGSLFSGALKEGSYRSLESEVPFPLLGSAP